MTSKRKKGTTNRKKQKQNNKTYYSLLTFAFIVIIIIAILRLGVVGAFLDASVAYILGTSRYFTYIIAILAGIYMIREQKVPLTKRMSGYRLFPFGLLFLLHSILFLSNKLRTSFYFTCTGSSFIIREPGSSGVIVGGLYGLLLFGFSSSGISLIGRMRVSVIFIYFGLLMITDKNIAESLTAHTNKAIEVIRTIAF